MRYKILFSILLIGGIIGFCWTDWYCYDKCMRKGNSNMHCREFCKVCMNY